MAPSTFNVYFLPVEPPYTETSCDIELLMKLINEKAYHPIYIHQFFEAEVIPNWPEDTKFIFICCKYTYNVYLRIIGEPLEGGLDPAKELILQQLIVVGPDVYKDVVTDKESVFLERCHNSVPYIGETVKIIERPDAVHEILKFQFPPEGSGEISNGFTSIHRRIEWVMHFFIETCSYIELSLDWTIYFMTRTDKKKASREHLVKWNDILKRDGQQPISDVEAVVDESEATEIVSFVSIYKHLAFPKNRYRVAQFFTPVNYQGKGYGTLLLEYLYKKLMASVNYCEMAVEDPGSLYGQLRDCVCLKVVHEHIDPTIVSPCEYTAIYMQKCRESLGASVNNSDAADTNMYIYNNLLTVTLVEADPNIILKLALDMLKGITTYLKETRLKLRIVLKESETQTDRLLDIIVLSKLLPLTDFLDTQKKKRKIEYTREELMELRGYRQSLPGQETIETLEKSIQLLPAKLYILMRYTDRSDIGAAQENLSQLDAINMMLDKDRHAPDITEESLVTIQNEWKYNLPTYLSTIRKVRKMCLGNIYR